MDRFETFCETIFPSETGLFAEMEKYAIENDVPIIRPGARRYLRWLLATIKPRTILELGTAIGFSAILMAQAAPEAGIITVENYKPRIPVARDNIKRALMEDRITLIEGDAAEVIGSLGWSFDLVFVDAAKAQYGTYLKLLMPGGEPHGSDGGFPKSGSRLHSGSVVVFDNVLAQDSGSTMDSRYAIERRDRTIHARMRELLKRVSDDPRFAMDLSSAGDGILTLTVR